MTPVELVFALVRKHVPMDGTELTRMEIEGKKDWEDMMAKDVANSNALEQQVQKHGKKWYVRLFTALAYIPLSIWLGREMNALNNPLPNLPNNSPINPPNSIW